MKPLSVGDLALVWKPAFCCGYRGDIGKHFIVLEIASDEYGPTTCNQCGYSSNTTDALEVDDTWHDIRTLKRIPPLSELDEIKEPEEVFA